VLVSIGVIILRRTAPDMPRPFRTPWVPFVPIAGAVICLAQMVSLPFETWERLAVWLLIGLAIYFLYGRHRANPNAAPAPVVSTIHS
jgi:APA family basic amino acid/polyamine antiporter